MSENKKDSGMVLKIGHLYPTLMSVAADRGNLFSIERRCKWRGIARGRADFRQTDTRLYKIRSDSCSMAGRTARWGLPPRISSIKLIITRGG